MRCAETYPGVARNGDASAMLESIARDRRSVGGGLPCEALVFPWHADETGVAPWRLVTPPTATASAESPLDSSPHSRLLTFRTVSQPSEVMVRTALSHALATRGTTPARVAASPDDGWIARLSVEMLRHEWEAQQARWPLDRRSAVRDHLLTHWPANVAVRAALALRRAALRAEAVGRLAPTLRETVGWFARFVRHLQSVSVDVVNARERLLQETAEVCSARELSLLRELLANLSSMRGADDGVRLAETWVAGFGVADTSIDVSPRLDTSRHYDVFVQLRGRTVCVAYLDPFWAGTATLALRGVTAFRAVDSASR